MLSLNNLKPNDGSRLTSKRIGRGNGSGKGTTAGRGMNGQNSRSGGGVPDWFEGGQTPLFRRLPKLKGFSNAYFKKDYVLLNLSDLQKLADKGILEISLEVLKENNLVQNKACFLKILGKGEISSKISVKAHKFSKTAKESLEKASCTIEVLS